MKNSNDWDIVIVGGGLGGLTTALHLSKHNFKVCLIEKNTYPNHKVCGEYVSNEVIPYLQSLDIHPVANGAKSIDKFQISTNNGVSLMADLPLGGFGLSRFAFDNLLYESIKKNATIIFDTVEKVAFAEGQFFVSTKGGERFTSEFVVGAFGKRSNLDMHLKRKFVAHRSPWLAVKNHYDYNFPDDTVALHNFNGGYCGLSKTETNVVNACYLTTFESFKKYGDIDTFQDKELSKNPFLKDFFKKARPVFEKPLTISQISFDEKLPVENHIFMVGDSAGLIHPLCGNGMAMAIKSAQIFSELYIEFSQKSSLDRADLEKSYTKQWRDQFDKRLKMGRIIQKSLMYPLTSKIGFSVAKAFPSLLPKIIEMTHGTPTE